MSRIPHYHLNQDGRSERFEAFKHQPCNVTWCQSNQGGGCVKMFNMGRMPNESGTPRCPGLQRIPPAPPKTERPKSRRTIVRKGEQTKIDQGGERL
jgi:hypothetical protein